MTIKETVTVKEVQDLQEFDSGFKKRVILVETKGEYPQVLPVEFLKERVEKIENVSYWTGKEVHLSFNLRGSEYNGRNFVNLVGWDIKPVVALSSAETTAEKMEQSGDYKITETSGGIEVEGTDGLPF